jgi:hypothetical protein
MRTLKFTFLFFISSFTGLSLRAQDIITLRSGEDVKSKIEEVGTNEVKYKKYENLSGPTYTMSKSDIFMIKYENGTKDIFGGSTPAAAQPQQDNNNNNNNRNNDNNARKPREENRYVQSDYDKYMKLYHKKLVSGIVETSLGVVFIGMGSGLLVYGYNLYQIDVANGYNTYAFGGGYTNAYAVIAVGAIFTAAAIPMLIIGPISLGRAFHYHGLAKKSQASMSFDPVLTPIPGGNFASGMGIKVHF